MKLRGISQRIVFFRTEAGLSGAELARRLSLTSSAVSAWETGVAEPTGKNRRRLAAVLGIPERMLLDDVEVQDD
jgi:transcriptional regulator with XRE-family HTH domain